MPVPNLVSLYLKKVEKQKEARFKWLGTSHKDGRYLSLEEVLTEGAKASVNGS